MGRRFFWVMSICYGNGKSTCGRAGAKVVMAIFSSIVSLLSKKEKHVSLFWKNIDFGRQIE
jgi:hypothetical protein